MILSLACLWEIVRSVVSHNLTRVVLVIQQFLPLASFVEMRETFFS